MKDPTDFFADDYFDGRDVTVERLLKFGKTVENNLRNDDPSGDFAKLADRLQALRTTLEREQQRIDTGETHRGGNVEQQNGYLDRLADYLKADQPLINYKATKNPLVKKAFFPRGLTEYRKANLQTAEGLFQRVLSAAAEHATALGAEFDRARYETLHREFAASRGAVNEHDQQVDLGRAGTAASRQPYTEALTGVVKTVVFACHGDAKRGLAYFPFDDLRRPKRQKRQDEPGQAK